ncbi:MTD2, partial [Trifolium pratense]
MIPSYNKLSENLKLEICSNEAVDKQGKIILALSHPRDKDGGCYQMRLSYSPVAPIFLSLVQWTDYRLAGALAVLFPALLQLQMGITDLDERKQKEEYAIKYQKKNDFKGWKESEIDIERDQECGVCLEVKTKVVLPNCCHQMCFNCYRDWCLRSQSCPFCRDSLKRVNSGDLWIYTDTSDIVDVGTIFKEN